MYEIKFVFSFTEEKFIATKIMERGRKIKMQRADFSKEVWQTIQDIGNVLTANIIARGGELIQRIVVSHTDLREGSMHECKCIELS